MGSEGKKWEETGFLGKKPVSDAKTVKF